MSCVCGSEEREVLCLSLFRMHFNDAEGKEREVKGSEIISPLSALRVDESAQIVFTIDSFQCDRVCGLPLACSIHTCDVV